MYYTVSKVLDIADNLQLCFTYIIAEQAILILIAFIYNYYVVYMYTVEQYFLTTFFASTTQFSTVREWIASRSVGYSTGIR